MGDSLGRSWKYQSAIFTPPPYRPRTVSRGVGECELFNVTADGPFADAEFRRQILNGIAPPLAQQIDDLLMTVVVPHTLTPFHLHGRIIQVKADRPCPD